MPAQLDDWRRLRLTQQMYHGRPQPRDQPLKFNGLARLNLMLKTFKNEASDTLYYEVLHQPLNELEGQTWKVTPACADWSCLYLQASVGRAWIRLQWPLPSHYQSG